MFRVPSDEKTSDLIKDLTAKLTEINEENSLHLSTSKINDICLKIIHFFNKIHKMVHDSESLSKPVTQYSVESFLIGSRIPWSEIYQEHVEY